MRHEVVIDPFGSDGAEMVRAAVAAERAGFTGVWVNDHFSGAVVGKAWSRDPFVVLGAIAAVTDRVRLGVLVANIVNRHPAQLASATNTVQSLAPGRVVLGVGSGAAPGSRFAVEHDAIGRQLGDGDERRSHLAAYVAALRAIWRGDATFADSRIGFEGLSAVIDGDAPPPIVIGASAWPTIELATSVADGVNIRRSPRLAGLLDRLSGTGRPDFEISVLDELDGDAPAAGADDLSSVGVARRLFTVPPDPALIGRLGDRLS